MVEAHNSILGNYFKKRALCTLLNQMPPQFVFLQCPRNSLVREELNLNLNTHTFFELWNNMNYEERKEQAMLLMCLVVGSGEKKDQGKNYGWAQQEIEIWHLFGH